MGCLEVHGREVGGSGRRMTEEENVILPPYIDIHKQIVFGLLLFPCSSQTYTHIQYVRGLRVVTRRSSDSLTYERVN